MVGKADWTHKASTQENSRPYLRYIRRRPKREPFTPAHILYGRRITTLPYHDTVDETDLSLSLGKQRNITQRATKFRLKS